MNYHSIYLNIVSKSRIKEGYTEKHHIIPKCLGGSDEPENIVDLTAREHFIVHLLLHKIHEDNRSLLYAVNMMSNMKRYNSKKYEWLKTKHNSEPISEETRRKRSESVKKHWSIDENRDKIRGCKGPQKNPCLNRKRGYKLDPNHCEKLKGTRGPQKSERTIEHSQKLGKKGKIFIYNKELDIMTNIFENEKIPEGFVKGVRPRISHRKGKKYTKEQNNG